MTDREDTRDVPRDCCGVIAIAARQMDVARAAFFGLVALQHRGQESAGIATSDGHELVCERGMGRVIEVFDDETALAPLRGHLAIGHTRYSTSGASDLRGAQPFVGHLEAGPVAVAHNGNLTNQRALREALLAGGAALTSTTDSELIVHLLAASRAASWPERLMDVTARLEGAWSLVVLTREGVWGLRDPLGFRPLCLGQLDGGFVLASESCALRSIGAELVREIAPGEVVELTPRGVTTHVQGRDGGRRALCAFEHVYLARPDSRLDGSSVHVARQRMGARLWQEAPVDADVVVAVPDSARSAAMGFAAASGIPYDEGFTRNEEVGRTFIQPTDRLRKLGVALKYEPLSDSVRGRRVVLVDDSIVRGNTAPPLVRALRQVGAREVHVRISSPPLRHPCFMGVDLPDQDALIAWRHPVEGVREHLGADSLAYLSTEGLLAAIDGDSDTPAATEPRHCLACFTGTYPLRVRDVPTT